MSAYEKYRNIVVSNADRPALELSLDLKNQPKDVQRGAMGGDQIYGFFYLWSNESKQPGLVLETVVSTFGDAITSVYVGHPAFETKAELMRAREALCRQIAEKVGLSVEAVGIDDEARGRTLSLSELGTCQLIDLLHEKVGKSLLQTDSYAAGVGKDPSKGMFDGRKIVDHTSSDQEPGVLSLQEDGSIAVKSV